MEMKSREEFESLPTSIHTIHTARSKKNATSTSRWSCQTVGFSMMGLLLLMNSLFLGLLVLQMKKAQTNIDTIVTPVQKILGTLDRFLHGSVPDLVTDFITIDFDNFGGNVSLLANEIFVAFDPTYDPDLLLVSQYASLVQSVSDVVKSLNPTFVSPPVPSDDRGVLNILAYAIEWIEAQTDPLSWQLLGKQCTALMDSVISTKWSGNYYWNRGTQYGSWDFTSAQTTFQKIRKFCLYASEIQPEMIIHKSLMSHNKNK